MCFACKRCNQLNYPRVWGFSFCLSPCLIQRTSKKAGGRKSEMDRGTKVCICTLERINIVLTSLLILSLVIWTALSVYGHKENDPFWCSIDPLPTLFSSSIVNTGSILGADTVLNKHYMCHMYSSLGFMMFSESILHMGSSEYPVSLRTIIWLRLYLYRERSCHKKTFAGCFLILWIDWIASQPVLPVCLSHPEAA